MIVVPQALSSRRFAGLLLPRHGKIIFRQNADSDKLFSPQGATKRSYAPRSRLENYFIFYHKTFCDYVDVDVTYFTTALLLCPRPLGGGIKR